MSATLEKKGEDSPESYEAIEYFVSQCTEIAVNLIDRQESEAAKQVLEQVDQVLRTGIKQNYPNLLYKISYRFAELANSQGDATESLQYLQKAMSYAEEYERSSNDPLLIMPAETYLNAAIAYQYSQRYREALEAAQNADVSSKRCAATLSEVQSAPSLSRNMSPRDTEVQLMSQLDIRVQSLLVKSQVLEKLNDFQKAISELKNGKKLLETHFGSQHPLMSDFQQVEGLIMT